MADNAIRKASALIEEVMALLDTHDAGVPAAYLAMALDALSVSAENARSVRSEIVYLYVASDEYLILPHSRAAFNFSERDVDEATSRKQ